ncbi:alanine--tRNA ligase-related protein [Candidatus Carsonella ruddii]|uniref:Alanine--tRNA ligase n=1 Tax=Candidatus Carsonella ruddii PC isolate NHV TaxID=1202540 RepID=J3TER3_CARRU|nr:alanine--tRNA ligase-related protein [Candidatus Carsonella ruddii]AFP84337.1 putative alanyl-tRNA synthetase [Candidatus Carsonella ruddii PC isolate NHV]
MKKFLKFFNFYYYKTLGTQNVNSNNKTLIFSNSGLSSLKKLIFNSLIDISSFQYCVRMQGIYNDLKSTNDGIHQTSFLMLGNFTKKNNFSNFKKIKKFLFLIKLKLKNLFFAININDYLNIITILIFKINISKIIFTKKNIWKINKNGYCGFCLEIYAKVNKKLLEIWNIVNISFIKNITKINFLKKKIIDTGLGLNRIIYIKKKNNNKINYKLFDIFNSIFLIYNYLINKKNFFFINKLMKKVFIFSYKNNVKMWFFLFYYFKKKKKIYFNFSISKFINFILKKEIFFLKNIKKIIYINKIKNFIFLKNTFGFYIIILYNVFKNNFL